MKKLLCIILTVALFLGTLATLPMAASAANNGKCGANLTWSLSGDTLTISGTGAMYAYIPAPWYSYRDKIQTVVIQDGATSIGNYAFCDCMNLTAVTIPDSVTRIGERAFLGCDSLASIPIPDGVTSIGDAAFYDTAWYQNQPDGLVYAGKVAYKYKGIMPENTSILLEGDTTGIADDAFSGCGGLTSVTIPESVTSIGDWAFRDCANLGAIIVDENNPTYSSQDGVLFNKDKTTVLCYPASSFETYTIPNSVTSIGEWAFHGCGSLASVTIPDNVTSIGDGAFCDCGSLTNITIPDSVTDVGRSAFSGCSSLASITIPEGVTSIGWSAFSGCGSLTDITVPESVTSIGNYAFSGCDSLAGITIPDSVTSIGNYAFAGCTALEDVYYSGTPEDRSKMSIAGSNEPFMNARWHYLGSAETTVPGDMDGDDILTAKDVTILRRAIASGAAVDNPICDFDGDGEAEAKDVTLLRRAIAAGN